MRNYSRIYNTLRKKSTGNVKNVDKYRIFFFHILKDNRLTHPSSKIEPLSGNQPEYVLWPQYN